MGERTWKEEELEQVLGVRGYEEDEQVDSDGEKKCLEPISGISRLPSPSLLSSK